MQPPSKKLKGEDKAKDRVVPNVVLGTVEFGRRQCDQKVAEEMAQLFVDYGHKEIDTALLYNDGLAEKIIGKFPAALKSQLPISTKANPWGGNNLTAESLSKQVTASLANLSFAEGETVDILYLHAPDHKTPIEETLEAVNKHYQAGKFKRLGLSNYSAWQVAEIYYLCKMKGYVLPTIYQGMYNALTRAVQPELFPCLRRFGIAFYAYNPLAGGLLTGKYAFSDFEKQPVGRFFHNNWAEAYQGRYWKKSYFDALDLIKGALKENYGDSVSLTDATLRWMMHHSGLNQEDAVILGASKIEQLRENLNACKEGPLHAKVVEAFDNAWLKVKAECPVYFR